MISTRYELTTYRRFLEEFADFLEVPFRDNIVWFPESVGEGFIKLVELQNNIETIITSFRLKHDMLMERKKVNQEYYTFVCEEVSDAKEFTIQIEKDRTQFTDENRSAIYLTGYLYDISYFFKGHTLVKSVRVLLSPEWMQQYLELNERESVLEKYIEMKTTGIWFKKVDAETREIFKELIDAGNEEHNLLFYQNRILKLVEKFFSGLHHEIQMVPKAAGISRKDIERVLKVENILVSDFSTLPPTIPELARTVALSESKLKKIFKSVYGLPLYEYFQKHRMEKAKFMLLTGKYSIKDVGYTLGYSNLSNFTLAFKKEFNQLPSDLLK
jgi:AraC-like DNA-binding protein